MAELLIDQKRISTPIRKILDNVKDLCPGYLKDMKPSGDDLMCTCPFHGNHNESHPSCGIAINPSADNYGVFNCLACHHKGPFYHFVAACFNESDVWAKEWLVENYSDGLVEPIFDLPEINLDVKKQKTQYMDEKILNTFQSFHPYMLERKLTQEVIDKFQIKYDTRCKALVFPVRDASGRLLMLTRRSVENKNFLIDAEKEKPVYLLNYLIEHKMDTAIVCESQINALTCHSYHLPGIALFGTGSSYQYDILNKSPIRHYILCFDGDSAGEKGKNNFIQNIRKDVFIDTIKMPFSKDVNDLSKEQFFNILQSNLIPVNILIHNYEEHTK